MELLMNSCVSKYNFQSIFKLMKKTEFVSFASELTLLSNLHLLYIVAKMNKRMAEVENFAGVKHAKLLIDETQSDSEIEEVCLFFIIYLLSLLSTILVIANNIINYCS